MENEQERGKERREYKGQRETRRIADYARKRANATLHIHFLSLLVVPGPFLLIASPSYSMYYLGKAQEYQLLTSRKSIRRSTTFQTPYVVK